MSAADQDILRAVDALQVRYIDALDRRDMNGLLATGVYHDLVAIEGGTARFRAKKALTDASALPHYVVYPL